MSLSGTLSARTNCLGCAKRTKFIARDEALHALFAVELYHTLKQNTKDWPEEAQEEKMVVEIVKEAVTIAEELIKKSLEQDFGWSQGRRF